MNIRTLTLICFSPTGTTRKILEGISRGLKFDSVDFVDMACKGAESPEMKETEGQFAIIGVPVHAGRVPVVAAERLQRLKARNVPAAVVVVYGNRHFDDALLELRDLAQEAGFAPLAGGAFIGEHSFSTQALPIAPNRPDADDLAMAAAFGEKIQRKLAAINALDGLPPLEVPGKRPYRERMSHPPMSPVSLEDICTLCGMCAENCPVQAITVGGAVETDRHRCILCCACVKGCPAKARIMQAEPIQKIAQWLYANCQERKTPEVFF